MSALKERRSEYREWDSEVCNRIESRRPREGAFPLRYAFHHQKHQK